MPLFPSGRQTSINDAVLCLFLRFKGPRQSNQIHLSYEREFPEERCESTTGKMCMLNRLSSFETNLSRRPESNVVFKGTVSVRSGLAAPPRTSRGTLQKSAVNQKPGMKSDKYLFILVFVLYHGHVLLRIKEKNES